MNIYETDLLLNQYLLFHYGTAEDQLPYSFGPQDALFYPCRCVSDFLPGIGQLDLRRCQLRCEKLRRERFNDDDKAFVQTLMHRVVEPGKIAGWIAPPARGIHGKPVDYEYVKFN